VLKTVFGNGVAHTGLINWIVVTQQIKIEVILAMNMHIYSVGATPRRRTIRWQMCFKTCTL